MGCQAPRRPLAGCQARSQGAWWTRREHDLRGGVDVNGVGQSPIPISMEPQGQTSAQMWQPTHFS